MKDFLAKFMVDPGMREQFPDPTQRIAVAKAALAEQAPRQPDIYDAVHATCCKGAGDIPQVQAVIDLMLPDLEEWWRETMTQVVGDAVERFTELEDRFPGSRPDPVTDRNEEELLVLAFLSVLERGSQAALPQRLDRLLRRSARQVLIAGGRRTGGLDLSQEPLLRSAAKDDLRAMLAGRISLRRTEIRDHALDFLRNARARRAAVAGDITEAFSGGARSLQEWLRGMAQLSGLETQRWLPQVVDQWAYRWFNIGAFRSARQSGVTEFVALAVDDTRTTPFCRWVNGRTVSTERIQNQLDKHIRFSTQGDMEGMARNWPMLPNSIVRGTTADFRRGFRRIGLPPYHFFCRTRVVPA